MLILTYAQPNDNRTHINAQRDACDLVAAAVVGLSYKEIRVVYDFMYVNGSAVCRLRVPRLQSRTEEQEEGRGGYVSIPRGTGPLSLLWL